MCVALCRSKTDPQARRATSDPGSPGGPPCRGQSSCPGSAALRGDPGPSPQRLPGRGPRRHLLERPACSAAQLFPAFFHNDFLKLLTRIVPHFSAAIPTPSRPPPGFRARGRSARPACTAPPTGCAPVPRAAPPRASAQSPAAACSERPGPSARPLPALRKLCGCAPHRSRRALPRRCLAPRARSGTKRDRSEEGRGVSRTRRGTETGSGTGRGARHGAGLRAGLGEGFGSGRGAPAARRSLTRRRPERNSRAASANFGTARGWTLPRQNTGEQGSGRHGPYLLAPPPAASRSPALGPLGAPPPPRALRAPALPAPPCFLIPPLPGKARGSATAPQDPRLTPGGAARMAGGGLLVLGRPPGDPQPCAPGRSSGHPRARPTPGLGTQ